MDLRIIINIQSNTGIGGGQNMKYEYLPGVGTGFTGVGAL
jgi:hypothetical protein